MNNESKENLNELTNAVKLMLQNMQVPAPLAAEVNQDLMQSDLGGHEQDDAIHQ
jgi:hypothetical protein